jgi:anti-anti-sigma regulatory factor
MLKAEFDKSRNLLLAVLSQHITIAEIGRWREQVGELLAATQPGFRVLVDMSHLELMDIDCVPGIAWSMEALDKAGISKVVRIIPDPSKDIGLKIMSYFHFRREVSLVTCDTMDEALTALAD